MKIKFLVVLMILGLAASAGAKGWSLYVNNKPLNAKIWVVKQNFYAPLNPLLRSLGYAGVIDNDTINLVSADQITGTITTAAPMQKFSFKGQIFVVPTIYANGIVYTEIKSIAKPLGYGVIYNADTKIVDVFKAKPVVASSTPTPAASPATSAPSTSTSAEQSSQATVTPASGSSPKVFPFKITKFDFYQNLANPNDVAMPSDVYGTVNLKNISNEKVNNIQVITHFKPADSTSDKDEDISTVPSDQNPFSLAAGEEISLNFYWRNISNLYYIVKVEIKYEGMPESGWPYFRGTN
jgi:hypothetical protein